MWTRKAPAGKASVALSQPGGRGEGQSLTPALAQVPPTLLLACGSHCHPPNSAGACTTSSAA